MRSSTDTAEERMERGNSINGCQTENRLKKINGWVHPTLWINRGKDIVKVFLFHFWKTFDVAFSLREDVFTFSLVLLQRVLYLCLFSGVIVYVSKIKDGGADFTSQTQHHI